MTALPFRITALIYRIRPLLFAVLCLVPAAVHAAEVRFPPGSRIGMAPAPGLSDSRAFAGFEDAERKVAVVLAELPAQAYPEALKSMRETGTTTPGVDNVKREILLTKSGAAHTIAGTQKIGDATVRKWIMVTWNSKFDFAALITVIVPQEAADAYPDTAVREMLTSLSLRSSVPKEEVLGSLPFRVSETADFRFARAVSPGRAVLLTDSEKPAEEQNEHPQMILSIAPGSPVEPAERERFSQQLLRNVQGLKDLRVTFSEPQRVVGLPGYEIRLEGKDAKTGADMTVVQWVRFGATNFVRVVGISPSQRWTESFPRFRRVRDGLGFR